MKRKVYLDDLPWEEALEKYLAYLEGIGALRPAWPELINVEDALGRVSASPVYARVSSPHYHASAMDGMAVKAVDTYGASETTPKRLKVGSEAMPVDTGDPLPAGCDAVIMIEDVHYVEPGVIEIIQAAHPWQHVRMVGEDVVATEMIFPANQMIRPVDIGAALAGGVLDIYVHPRPKVAILPTGTELVQPGTELKPGDIIEYNSRLLSATIKQWGGSPLRHSITADDFDRLREVVAAAADEADIVLINAG
jgi:putative molybdopterin biosynthesis protein